MASTINGTSTGNGGLISTGDDSGILNIQTNETTAITVDASQRVAFVAGTAALPAITTAGDTNTGIFFPAADTVAVSTGGSGRMFVNSSGYVGIGKSSPESGLDIRAGITGNFNAITMGYGRSANPTDAVHKISWSSDSLNIEADTANSIASNIIFTNDNTERMRINSNGALLINKTSQAADERLGITGNSGQQCAVLVSPISGDYDMINFRNTNGQVGRIGCNGTATSYITSSDYRLKENITPMTGALIKVAQLKPVTYKWKIDGSDGQGFIAHEPDCVSGEKDAVDKNGDIQPQGIDTSFLVATLTAALQETKALIDTQAETINALTARIVALETA